MSHSSWQEVLRICEVYGIPRDQMPDFSRYECGIDLPLDEILERNRELPQLLGRLPAEVVSGHHWLQVIVSCVRRGERVFFSDGRSPPPREAEEGEADPEVGRATASP